MMKKEDLIKKLKRIQMDVLWTKSKLAPAKKHIEDALKELENMRKRADDLIEEVNK